MVVFVLVCVVKFGALGVSLLTEYILDELADRDIQTRVFSTGSKMRCIEEKELKVVLDLNPDLIIFATPTASAEGPKKAIEILKRRPLIVITNQISTDFKKELKSKKVGYIVIPADSMLGARREFLDPTEMVLYNSDVLKVLAVTGVFRKLQFELDKAIEDLKSNNYTPPSLIIDSKTAADAARFNNPYAKSKAIAAYEIASLVSRISMKACFVEKDMKDYVILASAAHELMRIAAKLSDEAREIEKSNDTVFRTPHSKNGKILEKIKLLQSLQS